MEIINKLLTYPATPWIIVVAGVLAFGLFLEEFTASLDRIEREWKEEERDE